MKLLKIALLSLLILLTVFYLVTAIVSTEGDFVDSLVLKPFPGLVCSYGGGEDGRWARSNPGKPAPWWLKGEYTVIYRELSECYMPGWVLAYTLGYFAVIVAWLDLAVRAFKRYTAKRKEASG